MRRRIPAYSAAADLPPIRRARFVVLIVGAAAAGTAWLVLVLLGRLDGHLGTGAQTVASTTTVAVPVLALVAVAYGVWRVRLEVLAHTPGPVLVRPFVDRTSHDPEQHSEFTPAAVAATAAFQRCLVRTRIYGSTAIPSTGSSSEFVRVVEQAGESARGAWAAVARFARVLAPQAAYVVRAEMVRGADGRPGVIVELSRLPSASIPPRTVREDTWDRAVEVAAHAVAAAVLPRTRRCRMPPWTNWQGLQLPDDLFDLFQIFARQRDQRRFDEAMATLREALRRDPGNLALRLEMGKLQEQLEMHLDALLTYDDIIGIASRRDAELSHWWNPRRGGVDDWSVLGAPGLSRRHPVIAVARYRHIVILGLGDRIAAQWWDRPEGCATGDHPTPREIRRRYLRETLSVRLDERYSAKLPARKGAAPSAVPNQLDVGSLVHAGLGVYLSSATRDSDPATRRLRQQDLRVFLAAVAVREAERLLADRDRLRWVMWRHRALRTVLPRTVLDLIVLWSRLRFAMALAASSAPGTAGGTGTWPELPAGLTVGEWPAAMDDLGGELRRVLPGEGTLRWLDHYSAACLYALLLAPADGLEPGTSAERSDEDLRAARAAVAQLSRAVAGADSGHLGRQRDLLLSEDPDLDHLRSRPEFRDFEALTFGSLRDTQRRGPRIGVWEQATHVAEFVSVSSAEMARVWERRAARIVGPVDAGTVLRWLAVEIEGWSLAERLALDHRDWTARDEVARRIGPWAVGRGVAIVRRPHPRFSHEILAGQIASLRGTDPAGPVPAWTPTSEVTGQVELLLQLTRERMDCLAAALRADEGRCCPRSAPTVLADEFAVVRGLVAGSNHTMHPLPADDARAWASLGVVRWSALSAWFDDRSAPPTSERLRREHFLTTLRRRDLSGP